MGGRKKLLERILHPKGSDALLGTLLILVSMLYVFVLGHPPRYAAYGCYAVSAYCLLKDCIWCVRSYKANLKPVVTELLNRNRYIARYVSDVGYKTVVSAYFSLAINILYVLTNFLTGIHYRSLWSLTLASYYLLLTIMRFLLLKNTKIESLGQNLLAEYRKYRACAYVLLLMNFALIGIVLLAIEYNNGFSYAGYLIYIMAMYAFYNIASAITSLVKFRKMGSPVMSASKVINFASALISVLSLEMAMLNSFDTTGDVLFRNRMIGITGLVISILFIATSCYMIHHATRQIKKER